jgi:hypothetical protein
VRAQRKFKALNSLIGNVKTALTGTYHAVSSSTPAALAGAVQFDRRYDARHPSQPAHSAGLRTTAPSARNQGR